MKKIVLTMAVVGVALLLGGCKSKKENEGLHPVEVVEPTYTFTKEDTAAVIDQVNQFIERLKQKDIKGATEMLYYLDKDSIKEPTDQNKVRKALTLRYVAGCAGYKLDRIVFNSDIDNEAKIDIILFEKPEGDTRPNTTSYYFRPVRFEGKWYLTTKDNITDTHSELRNKREAEKPFGDVEIEEEEAYD